MKRTMLWLCAAALMAGVAGAQEARVDKGPPPGKGRGEEATPAMRAEKKQADDALMPLRGAMKLERRGAEGDGRNPGKGR